MSPVKIVECPRDAMQGLHHFIPTAVKADYINTLLQCGFDIVDGGSFVSPKAIPQMRDTAEVIRLLDFSNTATRLLVITANKRGGEEAVKFDEVGLLGFPFSISETFQQRNTNSSVMQSLHTVDELQQLCEKNNKQLVIYISMAFGNPYGDEWNADIACQWVEKIASIGVKTIALADTVGVADAKDIGYLFSNLIPRFPEIEFGAHLHCTPGNWKDKLHAAYEAGCRRFDAAMKGFGGCPMAKDELVGNMATENLVQYLYSRDEALTINRNHFDNALSKAVQVFAAIPAH